MAWTMFPDYTGETIRVRCAAGVSTNYYYDIEPSYLFSLLESAGIHSAVLSWYTRGYAILDGFGSPSDELYLATSDYLPLPSGQYPQSLSFSFPNIGGNFPRNYWLDYDWSGGTPVLVVAQETGYTTGYAFNRTYDGVDYYYRGADFNQMQVYYVTDFSGPIIKNGVRPVTYTWKSIPNVSGKLGTFTFSTIDDEFLNNGDPIDNVQDNGFIHLCEQTNSELMTENQPLNTELDMIYAGQVDRMVSSIISPSPDSYFKFFISSYSTPGYTISQFGGWYNIPLDAEIYLAFLIDDENQVVKPSFIYKYTVAGFERYAYNQENPTLAEMQFLYLWFKAHIDNPDDDPEVNDESVPEGINPWKDIPIEGLTVPSKSAIDTGFTTMYEISDTELRSLARFMWSDDFIEVVKKFFGDPKDIIVGLSVMPVKPDVEASPSNIKAGFVDTGVQAFKLTSQYKIFTDIGSIYIQKATDSFLDYEPYTKIIVHLPFVGAHSLQISEVMGQTLYLSYIFDFLTGSCVAELSRKPNHGDPRYFFGGNAGMQIPTSSRDFSQMFSSILSAGVTIGKSLATIATGKMTAPMAVSDFGNTLQNVTNMSPDVEHTSGEGNINGMLTTQACYISVEYPHVKVPEDPNSFFGRSSHLKRKLGNLNGFTKCQIVHLDTVPCYEQERKIIEQYLLSGVRFETGSSTPSYTPSSTGMMGIIMLKCTSDKEIIGKTFTAKKTIEGKLLYDQSIIKPMVLIDDNDILDCNYCYIPLFERFYFINNITVRKNTLVELDLEVDVLQSWKSDIENSYAILDRQEFKFNKLMNDDLYYTEQKNDTAFSPFMLGKVKTNFPRANNTYILTIAGSD